MNDKKSEAEYYSKVVFLPVLGRVPGPYPFSEKERKERSIPIPEKDLQGSADKYYYAVEATGENLSGDDVHAGNFLVVAPDAQIVDGGVYIARVESRVLSGHVTRVDEKCLLFLSDDRYDRMVILEKNVIGRVIYSGTLKEQ